MPYQNKLSPSPWIRFSFLISLFFFLSIPSLNFPAWAYLEGQETETPEEEKPADSIFSKDMFESKPGAPIEVNGDQVEFMMEEDKVVANGNVVIVRDKTTLSADYVELSRTTNIAIAKGHVILTMPSGKITGDKLVFNFEKMAGELQHARIMADPYYGEAETVGKVSENQISASEGYLTTCDLEKPHYRMKTKKVDIYPGDKVVARNIRMLVGKVPLIYLPKMTQKLKDKPVLTFTPGFDKQWGMYLLTAYRYRINDDWKGTLHLDTREKKDVAWGIDLDYKMKNMGKGIIRTYYMNERSIASKRFFNPRPSPTIEKERFRVEWRHRWEIDPVTDMTLQYARLSDDGILKEYFEREYEKDSSPQTFFLLTHNVQKGTLSFRVDKRVNRFNGAVERLPDIRYDITNQEIGNSKVYFRSANGFVNFSKKDASPTEVRKETMRFDSDNELSYPMKISFIELRPFVGQRETYYSKTTDPSQYNIIRGIFRTGSDLSTRFYRLFDVQEKFLGIEINKLRHVVTPSVAYAYQHRPTTVPSLLDTFDGVDSLDLSHNIIFSLENKLQTKRKGAAVDLLRSIVSSDFNLKEHPGKGGFNRVTTDWEFRPANWLRFDGDTNYDTQRDKLAGYNWEAFLDGGDKWNFGLGRRYALEADDQITMELAYRINPKWKFKIYRRFDVDSDILKEQEYTISRDLHCWEMDINFNETRGEGSEIWIVFRLKSFPDFALDFGTSFNKRKAGSQSTVEP